MGASVTVISRSPKKKTFARDCGADTFIVSESDAQMKAEAGKLDLLINTIPSYHDYMAYQPLLTSKGIQVILGLHAGLIASKAVDKIVGGRSRVKMSAIGGIRNTQEVMDLCDKDKIYPEISIKSVTELNDVFTTLDKANESGVRHVLDIANTLIEGVKCDAPPPELGPIQSNITRFGVVKELLYLLLSCKWR